MDRKPGHLTRNIQNAISSIVWVKVLAIGNTACGKTSLIKHFCESKFNAGYQPTVGVDYGFKIQTVSGHDLRVHLWDLSGASEYIDVRNELYGQSDVIVIVYDMTTQSSFDCLDTWIREVQRYSTANQAEVVIVANKSDLKNKRCVASSEGKKFASSRKYGYYETSASNGEGINRMFDEILKIVTEKKHLTPKF